MSYKTYITEALVCASKVQNTSDKSFLLFTREVGMLYALAKSVREERSKQRFALQECSHARITLIRGKQSWRITGAEALTNYYATAETREARALTRDVIRLLRRLVHGEEPQAALFDEVIDTLRVKTSGKESSRTLLFSLRALHVLGYIAPDESLVALLDHSLPYEERLQILETNEKDIKTRVSHALTESHL